MEVEVTRCPGAQIPKLKTLRFLPTNRWHAEATLPSQGLWGSKPGEGETGQELQGHQQLHGGAGWSRSA